MRTKALEWVKHPHANLWRAYCLLGCYQVAAISSPISWGFDGFDGVTKVADEALTEDAAFAAAQSHFDAAIASVLEDDDWQTMAAKDVLAERRRQVEAEGWTAEHDDAHNNDKAYVPTIIEFEGEGDPCWEFVLRDCPTVTGQTFAADVEELISFDGELIGFRIFKPSATPEPVAPPSPDIAGLVERALNYVNDPDQLEHCDPKYLRDDLEEFAITLQRVAQERAKLQHEVEMGVGTMTLLSHVEALTGPVEAQPLDAWSEDDGDVLWWAWDGAGWLGEAPYVGSPLDLGIGYPIVVDGQTFGPVYLGGWPGYHTHWTRLPPMPAVLRAKEGT